MGSSQGFCELFISDFDVLSRVISSYLELSFFPLALIITVQLCAKSGNVVINIDVGRARQPALPTPDAGEGGRSKLALTAHGR